MTALDTALARIEAETPASVAAFAAIDLSDTAVAPMVLQPWRIARAVYQETNPLMSWSWPVEGKSLGDVLSDCRARIARIERQPAHWGGKVHLPALRQAARAVEIIAAEGDRLPQARRAA